MPLPTPPPVQERRGDKRSRSPTLADENGGSGAESGSEMEERIPFLTTLSMNHSGLFYGRRDIPSRFVRQPVPTEAASSCDERKAARTTAEETTVSPHDGALPTTATDRSTGAASPGIGDDTTLLHSMVVNIMDAAAACNTSSGSAPAETLTACAYLLRRYFHFPSGAFKPHQQEICFSILGGQNTLAVCPTGWGKSLCYQFPMLVHRLLFECRYEQWCRQMGVSSALTNTDYARDGDDDGADCDGSALTNDAAKRAAVAAQMPLDLFSRFCIVVSPLVALMEDQAEKIGGIDHLQAFVLSSKVDAAREAQLLQDLQSPLCPLDILFISPERFIAHVGLRRLLQSQAHRIALLCVDEVHCVSGWAYDFRPTFMYVSRVLESPLLEEGSASLTSNIDSSSSTKSALAEVPYLCLTATATAAVVREVQSSFRIRRTVLCADQRRDNLELQVVDLVSRHAAFHSSASMTGNRKDSQRPQEPADVEAQEPSSRVVQDALLEAVRQLPKPMLVYVQSRADADELSGLLSTKLSMGGSQSRREGGRARGTGVFHAARYANCDAHDSDGSGCAPDTSAAAGGLVIRCYHAALSRSMRTATQRQFLEGRVDVLVATVAFGMGIDKANIRSIVHASAPSSLEGYVQEIGRAGRDGGRSICRILYNPFDFYALRCRLWTSLLSPTEMRRIVQAILSGPTTQVGQRLMLVSVSALSSELGFSEEAIETVLFLLLTQTGSGGGGSTHTPFRAVLGSYPLKYKVLGVSGEGEAGTPGTSLTPAASTASRRRKPAASAAAAASAGVGLLLRQLGATDAVLEMCRVLPNLPNQIEMANRLSLPLAELQQRIQDLICGNTITVASYGVPSALLVELGDAFAEAASPAGQEALATHLLALHRGRLDSQVRGLRVMFRLLAHPTHDAIASALRNESLDTHSVTPAITSPGGGALLRPWSPPGKSCGRLRAVSVANAFVEENRLRLRSTYEALRALMGIRPKSLIQRGKYAGQLPLEQSWYVNSPYFGALRTFDLAWVMQILAPHKLDAPPIDQ